jgi:hypothetical protein
MSCSLIPSPLGTGTRSDFGDNSGAILNGGTAMFRIIRGQGLYTTVATDDDIAQAIEHGKPGRYIVEEVSRAGELLPSDHSCRRWGTASRDRDGHVTLDPEPWPG